LNRHIRLLHIKLLFMVAASAASIPSLAQLPAYPETPRAPVTDSYQGVEVVDPYRWLEDGKDPKVRAWSEAQLAVTRAALDGPLRDELRERFKELLGAAPVRYASFHDTRGGLFALKFQPPRNQPSLVVMKSALEPASERVLLDLIALDAKGTRRPLRRRGALREGKRGRRGARDRGGEREAPR
jgi:prolyl oligopeptidase